MEIAAHKGAADPPSPTVGPRGWQRQQRHATEAA